MRKLQRAIHCINTVFCLIEFAITKHVFTVRKTLRGFLWPLVMEHRLQYLRVSEFDVYTWRPNSLFCYSQEYVESSLELIFCPLTLTNVCKLYTIWIRSTYSKFADFHINKTLITEVEIGFHLICSCSIKRSDITKSQCQIYLQTGIITSMFLSLIHI